MRPLTSRAPSDAESSPYSVIAHGAARPLEFRAIRMEPRVRGVGARVDAKNRTSSTGTGHGSGDVGRLGPPPPPPLKPPPPPPAPPSLPQDDGRLRLLPLPPASFDGTGLNALLYRLAPQTPSRSRV